MKITFFFHNHKVIIEAEINEIIIPAFAITDRGIKDETNISFEVTCINEVQRIDDDELIPVTDEHKNLVENEIIDYDVLDDDQYIDVL